MENSPVRKNKFSTKRCLTKITPLLKGGLSPVHSFNDQVQTTDRHAIAQDDDAAAATALRKHLLKA